MAAPTPKLKMKGLLDNWSTREKLALACSVQKNGDQNWVSVSRAIKQYGESHRPSDWFMPRNCARQYGSQLEKVETPKRKRTDRGEIDVPSRQIVTKVTIERTEELKKLLVEQQKKYKKLKRDIEGIQSGQWDDNIKEKWEEDLAAKEAEDEAKKEEERKQKEEYSTRAALLSQLRMARRTSAGSQSNLSEMDENTQDSMADSTVDVSQEEDSMDAPGPPTVTVTSPAILAAGGDASAKGATTASMLLSHLLKSTHKTPSDLQRIKLEQEQVIKLEEEEQVEVGGVSNTGMDQSGDIASLATPTASSTSQPSDLEDIGAAVKEEPSSDPTETNTADGIKLKQEVKDEGSSQESSLMSSENSSDHKLTTPAVDSRAEGAEDTGDQKTDHNDADNEEDDKSDTEAATYVSVDEEVSIKEEPASPASSIMSNISETRRRSRGSAACGRRPARVTRRSLAEKDDGSSRHSEGDNTDDETARESDDVMSQMSRQVPTAASAFLESVPNSPASTGVSDTEDEKAYKAWKKSIMLVWRSASNHKDASVFLHPVTNDIAPGYHNVVHRPMDMHTIKKNVENGTIRTTAEFQRDIMLMFTNAIMYNASNHNVYLMAKSMYDDVMEILEQYINTQMMVHSSDHKHLRGSRRGEDKDDDMKKRRSSVEQNQEGGKTKKRKRGDE